MITKINSIAINGLISDLIEIEVDINQGLPSFTIVGLPDQGVQESKERLRSALKSSGSKLPSSRITVNLAPADIKKTGPNFDLGIAVGILLHEGIIENNFIGDSIFIGELSLDGTLRKINGVLPSVIGAREKGFKRVFVPKENTLEASIIPGIEIIGIDKLIDLISIINKKVKADTVKKFAFNNYNSSIEEKYDFKFIIGQKHVKRALEIAASGGHNIIMSGPPGSGKTMLSKAFSTILPDLNIEEAIEVSKIYSISGLLNSEIPIITKRPFRTIHHTASSISIIGGGRNAKPGEISLAHKGVLFLDEVLEFDKNVLEVLRQPIEDGEITINRVNASFKYPAKFILVGAMNPCPCGFLSAPDKDCVCNNKQILNYKSKLSGPLIDRIDIFIEVPKVKTEYFKVSDNYEGIEDSKKIKNRVEMSRQIQLERFKNTKVTFNSEMSIKEINKYCKINDNCEKILKQAISSLNLSARAYYRILKLSRTIADLDNENDIQEKHILEALSYRKKED